MTTDSVWAMERDAFLSSSPPRRVPPSIAEKANSNRSTWIVLLVGGVFVAFGILFSSMLAPFRLLEEWRLKKGPSETVEGRVVSCESTNYKENGARVWKHSFVFETADGKEQQGVSYGYRKMKEGGRTDVRYLPEDPEIAMIIGGRMDKASPFVLFVLIFPVVGAVVVLGAVHSRRSTLRLLRNGFVGQARIDAVEKTFTQVNGTNVHKIRLTRIDDGVPVVSKSWDDSEISMAFRKKESGEPIVLLYDPKKPKRFLFPESWEPGSGMSPRLFFEENPQAVRLAREQLRPEIAAFIGMPTPRRVPRWIVKKNTLGFAVWAMMLFGLPFLLLGVVATKAIFPWRQIEQWRIERGEQGEVEGTITAEENPKVSINDEPVKRFRYVFRAEDGAEREGAAYVTGGTWQEGGKVRVRYLLSDPGLSVPEGGRLSIGSMADIWVLLFPFIGGCCFFIPIVLLARRRKLLRYGKIATARMDSMRKTNVSVNRQPQYRINLVGEDGTRMSRRTHDEREISLAAAKLESGEPVTILHDPMKPDRLILVESW